MTSIRRYFRTGQVYFLTHVTAGRQPILVEHIDLLWLAYRSTVDAAGSETIAYVILPDHVHHIIDPKGENLSDLMKRFKLRFSGLYRERIGILHGRVWQNRFWDHVIRDQEDLNRHIDYIHINPVKHGLVRDPFCYENSTLAAFYAAGLYQRDWGCQGNVKVDGDFGE